MKPTRGLTCSSDGQSLVRSTTEMMDRVRMIHEQINDAALVEEYIEGDEITVGILGNEPPFTIATMRVSSILVAG